MIRLSGVQVKQLKNRSSKDLLLIVHDLKRAKVFRSASNAALQEMANRDVPGALKELKRRETKRAKREAKNAK